MMALWSGGVNMGARGHDAGHLSLLVVRVTKLCICENLVKGVNVVNTQKLI